MTRDKFDQLVKGHKLMKDYLKFMVEQYEESEQPELIQGLTAEQWQEIIDDGYLCEFGLPSSPILGVIKSLTPMTKGPDWFNDGRDSFQYCRPAQIKGVMRPIFVEPVDKEAYCLFFNEENRLEFEGIYHYIDKANSTKYIEV